MATYFFGSVIAIDSAVSTSGAGSASYSVPSGKYAVVQVGASTGGTITITIAGNVVAQLASAGSGANPNTFWVGPGMTISATSAGTTSIVGVQFLNNS